MRYTKEIAIGLLFGGLVAGGLYWDASRKETAANIDAATLQVQTLVRLAESIKRKQGAYPAELPASTDPWGKPYAFTIQNDAARVCSNGPDGKTGGGDDICAPQ